MVHGHYVRATASRNLNTNSAACVFADGGLPVDTDIGTVSPFAEADSCVRFGCWESPENGPQPSALYRHRRCRPSRATCLMTYRRRSAAPAQQQCCRCSRTLSAKSGAPAARRLSHRLNDRPSLRFAQYSSCSRVIARTVFGEESSRRQKKVSGE